MNINKLSIFENSQKYFICPVCSKPLFLKGQSLCCSGGHCFDIAKQGYVNLSMSGKKSKNYDKESFNDRHAVLEGGYYSHILHELLSIITDFRPSSVIDSGCGEGYYARAVAELPETEVLAFDLSKDSIQLAAKSSLQNSVKWFVGDLSRIPLADKSVNCILDIFSPANYREFRRILANDGIVIKVIPGFNHLSELRDAIRESLINKEYSNNGVIEYFQENLKLIKHTTLTKVYDIPKDDLAAFKRMTPLLFNVEKEKADLVLIDKITVEGEILIGKKR